MKQHGYSLTELLTIVAIVGMVALVSMPAFMQLMPQYRIRSAASELGASLRFAREKAMSTRSQWKMTIDSANEQYGLSRQDGGSWVKIGENGRPVRTGGIWMKQFANVDIDGETSFDVILQRDGTPAAPARVTLATSSTSVTYNRYTIEVTASGNIKVTPWKE